MKKSICILILMMTSLAATAQGFVGIDTLEVFFRVNSAVLDTSAFDNKRKIDEIVERMTESGDNKQMLMVLSGASPEGPTMNNLWLTEHRANALLNYLRTQFPNIRDRVVMQNNGQQWERLTQMVRSRSDVPSRSEVLRILTTVDEWSRYGGQQIVESRKNKLMALDGGRPWRWMQRNLFPDLRTSALVIVKKEEVRDTFYIYVPVPVAIEEKVHVPVIDIPPMPVPAPSRVALKTNLGYDVMHNMNLGLEVNLGGGFSIAALGIYGWWKNDLFFHAFRSYGGSLELRKYLGGQWRQRAMTGHHLGIYGQAGKWGHDTGYHGEEATNMWYAGGINYGYSVRIGRKLNLDLGIGVGVARGDYRHYQRVDNQDIWGGKISKTWIGPTKADLTLVWFVW